MWHGRNQVAAAADANDDEDMFADDAPEDAPPAEAPAGNSEEKHAGEGPSDNTAPAAGSTGVVNGTAGPGVSAPFSGVIAVES
jgi:hypothetical protein